MKRGSRKVWWTACVVGYTGFYSCRSGGGGGRVSVFVASELQASVVPHHTFISETLELCTVEVYINNNKEKLFISGAYRPPSAPLAGLSGVLEGVLSQYINSSLILTGDFNIDFMNEEQSHDFSNLLSSFNFLPLITITTRITDHSAKCPDHIWTNDNSFMFSGSIIIEITDHYPIFAIYNTSSNKKIITLIELPKPLR